MKYTKEDYKQIVDNYTPKNKCLKNCVMAFVFGGSICTIGEIIKNVFTYNGMASDEAGIMASVVLVGSSALLTGFGLYDKLGKIGGAGTIVPITGFANSVVAPALEFKREGFILGTAGKIFTIAGPVLLYGYCSSIAVGLLSIILKGVF